MWERPVNSICTGGKDHSLSVSRYGPGILDFELHVGCSFDSMNCSLEPERLNDLEFSRPGIGFGWSTSAGTELSPQHAFPHAIICSCDGPQRHADGLAPEEPLSTMKFAFLIHPISSEVSDLTRLDFDTGVLSTWGTDPLGLLSKIHGPEAARQYASTTRRDQSGRY